MRAASERLVDSPLSNVKVVFSGFNVEARLQLGGIENHTSCRLTPAPHPPLVVKLWILSFWAAVSVAGQTSKIYSTHVTPGNLEVLHAKFYDCATSNLGD